MEFKQFRRVIPIVKEIAQNLQQFTEKVITNINKVLENGVFSDSAKEAFTDIKAEAANQKENFAKAASQEAEAVKEETTQEETTTDTTKESKMENPTEGINEESKKASSVIVNIAESINSVLVKTVKVASSIEAALIALSNLANTLGASSMAAAL